MRTFFLTEKGVTELDLFVNAGVELEHGPGSEVRELIASGDWHFIAFDLPATEQPEGVPPKRAHVSGAILPRLPAEPIESFLDKFVGAWITNGTESFFVTGCKVESKAITLANEQFILGSNMVVRFHNILPCHTCPEVLRDQGTKERQAG